MFEREFYRPDDPNFSLLLIFNVSTDILIEWVTCNIDWDLYIKKYPVGGFHKSYGNKCNYILRERIIVSYQRRLPGKPSTVSLANAVPSEQPFG